MKMRTRKKLDRGSRKNVRLKRKKGIGRSMTSLETDIRAKREKVRPRIQPMTIPQNPIALATLFEKIPVIPDAIPVATISRMAMDNSCTVVSLAVVVFQGATHPLDMWAFLPSRSGGR